MKDKIKIKESRKSEKSTIEEKEIILSNNDLIKYKEKEKEKEEINNKKEPYYRKEKLPKEDKGIGLFKQFDSKRINEERKESALKQSQETADEANKRLKEIEKEYYSLKEQYEKKKQECDSMNMRDSDWFEKHSKCQSEANELQSKITSLEIEDRAIKNKDYTVYYDEVKPMSYQIFYIIGASIAGAALLGAFII